MKTASVLQEAPAYPLGEAARYVRLAPTTLSSWLYGRPYPTAKGIGRFDPLIRPADSKRRLLSFNNLVEAHVLRALRATHRMELKAIRAAITYAERHLGIERLLLSRELLTDGQSVFLERYGQLINLSRSGQLTLRVLLNAYLQRIDRDDSGMPLRLFPFVRGESDAGPKHIAIDPAIGFGRPIVRSRGVSTHAIVDRIDAGESVADVAADYGLARQEVEEAIVYERAA